MSVRSFAGQIINSALKPLSLRLLHQDTTLDWDASFQRFRRLGFEPKTIVDIGVAEGTPELYRNFLGAYYILIDPLREVVPIMQALCSGFPAGGEFHNVALGYEETEATLEVRPNLAHSTLLEEASGKRGRTSYKVPMRRFDALMADRRWSRPCLCKIDVQGAELMVLEGMGARINEIDMFVIETSLIATLKDAPECFEILRFLKDRGWVMADVLSIHRRPLDKLLTCIDAVFVRENDGIRADKRWEEFEPRRNRA